MDCISLYTKAKHVTCFAARSKTSLWAPQSTTDPRHRACRTERMDPWDSLGGGAQGSNGGDARLQPRAHRPFPSFGLDHPARLTHTGARAALSGPHCGGTEGKRGLCRVGREIANTPETFFNQSFSVTETRKYLRSKFWDPSIELIL